MFLVLISFIAVVLTVLAPCILPLLPVIVGGSLSGGTVDKKKAFVIVFSLGLSVILFTLLLKVSTLFIHIPENFWKWFSGGIVSAIGIIMIFPSLWESGFIARLSARANILLGKGEQKKNFAGDIIMGAALGPVFSTCSPTYFIVLATVLPVSPTLGILYLLSYTVGLCLSLLLITFLGQKIMSRLNIAADSRGWFKKVFGVLFLIVGIAIISGFDKQLQTRILNSGFFDVTKIEQKLLEKNNVLDINESKIEDTLDKNVDKEKKFKKAPELSSIDGFINTDGKPITLAELKGKVVLLDIWTYSCINCQRTIPYINDWYAKYKDQGLVIIGLHTPEFSFERVQSNVEKAVEKFGIKYPVVLDNDYSTWQALGNQFWPRKYLIDIDGYIVYDHIGEGNYKETEQAIQKALKERVDKMGVDMKVPEGISEPSNVVSFNQNKVKSPEVYFGSARNEYLGNGKSNISGEQIFSFPFFRLQNRLYLEGTWNIDPEYAENKTASSVFFEYDAKNVYMTAGSVEGVEIEIYKDDTLVKKITIKDEQLYPLIEDNKYGKHTLKIKILKAGLRAFTFTFG